MRRSLAVSPVRLIGPLLAVVLAAVGGAAIGGVLRKDSGSTPSAVTAAPSAPDTASGAPVRARLRSAMTQLDGVRGPMRDRLATAATPRERADAANAIGDAYRAAAQTLAPLKPGISLATPTVAAMRRLWRDYQALGRAAAVNDAAAFARVGTSITEGERGLDRAMARWQAAT